MRKNRKTCKGAKLFVTALLLLFMIPLSALAQEVKITGTVTDAANGDEIIGVTVKVQGAAGGTITDIDGRFQITARVGQSLEFTYIGYQKQVIKVTKAGVMNVRMVEDATSLSEVVVVGYGVMKRSDLTGSVSSIDEKAIKQGVNTSIEQAMQGRIAGVQVTQNSGAPGGGISVQIRGINSLSGNEPLYVVDGVAMSGQTDSHTSVMSSLNPADITSIEVLKDASATAIYGSRASNGVVLITTKKGQEGNAKLSYEGYFGWQKLPKMLEVMNLPEYGEFYNQRAKIQGWTPSTDYLDPTLLTEGTNWQDELFQTAFMHNHQVGVSGGTKTMHYAISGGLLDQDGVGLGSGFRRNSVRGNFDTQVNDWLQLGASAYYAYTKQIVTFEESNVIQTALVQYPDVAPYNADGTLGFGETHEYQYQSNPIFEASMIENRRANSSLDYNFFANITPLKGLVVRIEYGGNRGWGNTFFFQPDYSYGNVVKQSVSTHGNSRNKYESFKQYATYDFDPLKGHHFQIMAGHESQEGEWFNGTASRVNYIFDTVHSLNVGDTTGQGNEEQGSDWAIESYYGRFNYNLLDRYLLTATLRADGSSNFAKGNRWGYFPSVALAWRITQEPFMKKLTWLSNAKLRLGWGLVGNQNASNFAYGSAMKAVPTAWGTGYFPENYANDKLTWERTKAWNVGLDLSFLDNRIEFIVDAYFKKTDDLLMVASLPAYLIPTESYYGIRAPWVNAGSIQNKGIEFTLNTVNVATADWQWRTNATISFNRNKLTGLNNGESAMFGQIGTNNYTCSVVGEPVGQFWGWKVKGMYTEEADFYVKNKYGETLINRDGSPLETPRPATAAGEMYPIGPNSIWVGDYIFEDVNGDGKIDSEDCTFIGNPNPDFTFGINNTITWKNLELSFFINGSVGNDVYNYVRQHHLDPTAWGNKMKDAASYARVELINPDGSSLDLSNVHMTNVGSARVARITGNGQSNNDNYRVSSLFVEDGSYIRMKSLSLAWNLPKKWLIPLKLDWVQIYGNIQNVFTITGYDGYDPELGSSNVMLQGIDNYRYPSSRIYNFGVKVNF